MANLCLRRKIIPMSIAVGYVLDIRICKNTQYITFKLIHLIIRLFRNDSVDIIDNLKYINNKVQILLTDNNYIIVIIVQLSDINIVHIFLD
jgi:hypothetical protein